MGAAATLRPVSGRKIDPVALVTQVCKSHGDPGFVRRVRRELVRDGVAAAVRDHDSARLYEWLMRCFNFQGVSDAVAVGYLREHGEAKFRTVNRRVAAQAHVCPKLAGFEAFKSCGYVKSRSTCNNPRALPRCPVPTHRLRKGALHQAAYSLYFFIRDKAAGDLVSFIDQVLERADKPGHPDRIALMRHALMGELLQIFGASHKIITMAFADLLLGGDRRRRRWHETGGSMIAVDTLVHNFLHRTGIHYRYETEHKFGSTCYGPQGCERIVDAIARTIDARTFNPAFPPYFPRFVQHTIWRFCAEGEADVCNGRRIDDRERCGQRDCPVFAHCGRIALKR